MMRAIALSLGQNVSSLDSEVKLTLQTEYSHWHVTPGVTFKLAQLNRNQK